MNIAIRKAGWSVTAIAALAAAFAPSVVVHAAGPDPVVYDCTRTADKAVQRPSNMLLACGDGGLWVKDITWTSWGPDTAEGEGTQSRRVCVPNCAAGGVATAPTHITLRDIEDNRFRQALISDLNGKPETWPL
ncbi:hypothetical protein GFY24_14090 [Nocardia sp. SYP-A9097]|uniref:hypothetical protein n=1 Tax=Nocardia sp. SYP-A9097 TaxID=2663237 RepID=UPI00129BD966|nr:hypothetical protein [Nocardia sp. SYP-A9097]MRH88562.1 hypothetical protein [Nocardia sp. SYP-A9097]